MSSSQSPSVSEAKDSRNYTCQRVCDEIIEIIRVLQLTSADDDDLDIDDVSLMRRALVGCKTFYIIFLILICLECYRF